MITATEVRRIAAVQHVEPSGGFEQTFPGGNVRQRVDASSNFSQNRF